MANIQNPLSTRVTRWCNIGPLKVGLWRSEKVGKFFLIGSSRVLIGGLRFLVVRGFLILTNWLFILVIPRLTFTFSGGVIVRLLRLSGRRWW